MLVSQQIEMGGGVSLAHTMNGHMWESLYSNLRAIQGCLQYKLPLAFLLVYQSALQKNWPFLP